MSSKRTIVVVTGSRAEFGMLVPVMRAIGADPRRLRLRIVAAGLHLATGTWRDIAAQGFHIDARVPMQKRGRIGRAADVAATGAGVIGFGKTFSRLKPEVVLVVGDRIEAFAAAAAASIGGVRVAHIHGGDRAEGVADEAMRHAISKMAHLHLAATALSRQRLVRMGEDARGVFNVGSPAVDGLSQVRPADDAPRFIVMQHPVGGDDRQERQWMTATLAAVGAHSGAAVLVMAPNGDPGAAGIRQAIAAAKVQPVEHLPRDRFLSLLKGAAAIVGNSSAGLIEAAVLHVPTVNIGPRQAGRQAPGNVISCDYGQAPVAAAVGKALRLDRRRLRHPYGDGRTGEKIARLLATVDWDCVPVRKRNRY